jgi:hypothetical protein
LEAPMPSSYRTISCSQYVVMPPMAKAVIRY